MATNFVAVGQGEQHHVDDAVGRLDLGPLVALEDVLDDQRMEAERRHRAIRPARCDGETRSIQTVGPSALAQVGQGARHAASPSSSRSAPSGRHASGSGRGRRPSG